MDWYELLPKILNMSLTASVIIVTVPQDDPPFSGNGGTAISG